MSINTTQNLKGYLSSKIKLTGKLAVGRYLEDDTRMLSATDDGAGNITLVVKSVAVRNDNAGNVTFAST